MSVLFGVLNIGRHAFLANQRALAVTAQNIANVNTPGYARQEVIFGSFATANGEVATDHQGAQGMGVRINGIRRAGGAANTVLEERISAGLATLGRLGAEEAAFNRIESLFNDSKGTGLNQLFSDFFSAMQDVANSPDDLAARGTLITRADTLASAFVSTDRKLKEVRSDARLEIDRLLPEINEQTKLIARLNDAIATATASGQDVGELKNQRLLIMNELSANIGFVATEDPLNLGKVDIVVPADGDIPLTLVDAGDPQNLSTSAELTPAEISTGFLFFAADAAGSAGSVGVIRLKALGGRVGGLANMQNVVIPGFLSDLDTLAVSFITEVNAQHVKGTDRTGVPAGDFFTGDSAATMGLVIDDPTQIAASALGLTGTVSTVANVIGGVDVLTNRIVGVGTAFTTELEPNESIVIGANTYTVSSVISDTELLLTTNVAVKVEDGTALYLPQNNRNAISLSLLQGTDFAALGPATFQDFYESLVSTIGVQSQAAGFNLSAENVVQTQIEDMKAEISGVSLEQELINITKYQRAAESAARLVSVADELLGTLIALGT